MAHLLLTSGRAMHIGVSVRGTASEVQGADDECDEPLQQVHESRAQKARESGGPIAVVLRCGASGGRCGRTLGKVTRTREGLLFVDEGSFDKTRGLVGFDPSRIRRVYEGRRVPI